MLKHLKILVSLGGKRLRESWNQSPGDPEGQLFNKNALRKGEPELVWVSSSDTLNCESDLWPEL